MRKLGDWKSCFFEICMTFVSHLCLFDFFLQLWWQGQLVLTEQLFVAGTVAAVKDGLPGGLCGCFDVMLFPRIRACGRGRRRRAAVACLLDAGQVDDGVILGWQLVRTAPDVDELLTPGRQRGVQQLRLRTTVLGPGLFQRQQLGGGGDGQALGAQLLTADSYCCRHDDVVGRLDR